MGRVPVVIGGPGEDPAFRAGQSHKASCQLPNSPSRPRAAVMAREQAPAREGRSLQPAACTTPGQRLCGAETRACASLGRNPQ